MIAGETQRAADGLALSSRNGYLSEARTGRSGAALLALRALARDALAAAGAMPEQLAALEARAMHALAARGWQPDYLTVRRRADLHTAERRDALDAAIRWWCWARHGWAARG